MFDELSGFSEPLITVCTTCEWLGIGLGIAMPTAIGAKHARSRVALKMIRELSPVRKLSPDALLPHAIHSLLNEHDFPASKRCKSTVLPRVRHPERVPRRVSTKIQLSSARLHNPSICTTVRATEISTIRLLLAQRLL
jgi:hypothetical protein